MTVELDISLPREPIRVVPVLPTAVDFMAFTGDGVLCGWSLRDGSAEIVAAGEGSVTAPAALATIATTASIPAGAYTVSWTVSLAGAAVAADANNFRLVDANGNVVVSVNLGAAGEYAQDSVGIVTTLAGAVFVQAIGAGTAGVTYTAQISIVPSGGIAAIVEIRDGNNILGCSTMIDLSSDTQVLFDDGLHIRNQLLVHVIQGAVTGSLWARFNK